jgi:two-component system sensor histidine kinase KdpD
MSTLRNTKLVAIDSNEDEPKLSGDKKDLLVNFVAIMVHDLQGPFVSMKTMLKLLKSGRFDLRNKAHQDLMNSSILALDRAETIIYDLIDIAKGEAIGLPVNLEFCDLNEQINNSLQTMYGSAFEYGVTLQPNLQTPVKAQMDKNLFLRVIDNLIFNALKHSVKGGTIMIDSAIVEDKAVITVSDEGEGLKNLNAEDLFDKYKQVNLRQEGKYKGVGLGLYFCRLAINSMGGHIWAEENPRGGASFKVSLIKDRRRE